MKKTFSALAIIFFCNSLMSQLRFDDSISSSRNNLIKDAMITLGGWATANIASGFIIAAHSSGEAKYSWQMNAYWNFFSLGLAGLGYAGLHRSMQNQYALADNIEVQHSPTDSGMILCNMGKAARSSEPAAEGRAFTSDGLSILAEITAPGTLEGGDVAWLIKLH